MNKIKFSLFLFLYIFLSLQSYAQHNVTKLWYNRPAINFNEALPVGNGRMGGMVYGRVRSEYISSNEQTLWSGGIITKSLII